MRTTSKAVEGAFGAAEHEVVVPMTRVAALDQTVVGQVQRIGRVSTKRDEGEVGMGSHGSSGLAMFLSGLLLGAAFGLLFAPRSGRETRDMIAARAAEAKERALAAIAQAGETTSEAAERARAAGLDVARRARTKVEAFGDA